MYGKYVVSVSKLIWNSFGLNSLFRFPIPYRDNSFNYNHESKVFARDLESRSM